MIAIGSIVAVGVLLIVTIGTSGSDEDAPSADQPAPPQPKPTAPQAPASALPAPVDRPNLPDGDELARWSIRVSTATEMPRWAAEAYGRAEMWMRSEAPGCHISWATLAALSWVENGPGPVKAVPVGADHWERWKTRASKDGKAPDRDDVHDAALTAARFLCDAGGDLSSAKGWWRAMLAFDQSKPRVEKVRELADDYARRSQITAPSS